MNEIIISHPSVELVKASDVSGLLRQIRPAWQAKDLIERVKRLINVDPSSACQRLFNAAIHDLREKVVIAGIDIAKDTAKQYKLPPVDNAENVESYSVAKLIDLVYRIGLITRPEWRRLTRCYEIRRDLEHEDDEYEAGVEDCIYIFQTCIPVVLARDPIHLLRVVDVKQIVEQPLPCVPSPSLLQDYEHAPQPRQEEILKFLISIALDDKQPELVRQNAFAFLKHLASITQTTVTLAIAAHLQEKITRIGPSRLIIRVAFAAGVLSYLKQVHLKEYFSSVFSTMEKVGYSWRAYNSHGELLNQFKDVGGLRFCPQEPRTQILRWLVLAYIGTPGGYTSFGNIRNVFYSNTAAPLIEDIIKECADLIKNDLKEMRNDKAVKKALSISHIERRFEELIDLVDKS